MLVHGGMAQDVGPILEMVAERYLLRSDAEWTARQAACKVLDEIIEDLRAGDVRAIGGATQRNFDGPIQSIIPWASNLYTETLIREVRDGVWRRVLGILDAGRNVRRRNGIHLRSQAETGGAEAARQPDARGERETLRRRGLRHETGRL